MSYIPKNLDECFAELKKIAPPGEIDQFMMGSEDDLPLYHHGIGCWIRNNWGLWAGSELKNYFKLLGLYHADDISGVILRSFYRHLRQEPLKIDEQIKHYHDYWEKNKQVPFDK